MTSLTETAPQKPGAIARAEATSAAWLAKDEDGPMRLIGPLMLGKAKWLGAAEVRGSFVGMPGHAQAILRIDPRLDRATLVGRGREANEHGLLGGNDLNRHGINRFKWLRGVTVGASCYGIPMHADAVLKVTPRVLESKIQLLGDLPSSQYKWHGGVLAPNGKIYGVPCYASTVLCIDPSKKDAVSTFGDVGAGKAKWYGGILGPDGNMYCVPFAATRVLRVLTKEDRAELVGPELSGGGARGGYKWHGGCLGPDGRVYGFPMNANSVLRIDCATGAVDELPLPTEETFNGGKYKWGGGCVANGRVYGIPSDATRVLKIECASGDVSLIGDVPARKNKWQGGVVGGDGCIWGIPCDAPYACRVDPTTNTVELVGDLPDEPDKFQGGYADHDGNVWCVPECGRRVLKIRCGRAAEEAFVHAYLDRLGLQRAPATRAFLDVLVERHLAEIPFENVDLVLQRPGDVSSKALRDKILSRRRGGHCVELNGLFSEFLARLGYDVKLLACRSFAGPEVRTAAEGFRAVPSHMAIAVKTLDGEAFFVDVGFGEAPLSPLPLLADGVVIKTPEGMESRILHVEDDQWELQWLRDGAWTPRLRWAAAAAERWDQHSPTTGDFLAETERWRRQPLGRKLLCSKLTRDAKITVAGARLKVTSPRFGPESRVTITELGTADAVRDALHEHFGIPLSETVGLELADPAADKEAFRHL